MSQNYVAQEFNKRFEQITPELEFNPSWHNGTGYFDRAVTEAKLPPGHEAKTVADDGRKIILIGTRSGTCVVFERELSENRRICSNLPRDVEKLVGEGNLVGEDKLHRIVGNSFSPNIGIRLEEMFSDYIEEKKMEKPSLKDICTPSIIKIQAFAERVIELAKTFRSDEALSELIAASDEARIHLLTNDQFVFSTVDTDGTTFGEEGVVMFLFDKTVTYPDFVASILDWKNTAIVLGNGLGDALTNSKVDMYDINVFDFVFSQSIEMKDVRTIARFDL